MPISERDSAIKLRVFLVGCQRSGTTLLQVLIAGHPRIHSFPETSFFINGIGLRRRPLAWLGLATGKECWAIEQFLRGIGREDLSSMLPKRPLLLRTSVGCFVQILDHLTLEEGKDIWLEKSPMHIHYIRFIKKYIPNNHFIHIIRDGRDVVASNYARALQCPSKFGRQQKLTYGIRLWNRSLKTSVQYLGKPGHTFVLYEQLVAQPELVLIRLCDDVGITYNSRMIDKAPETAQQVVLPHALWMVRNVMQPPQPQPSKFDRLFDQETREWISRKLKLSELEKIKKAITRV
jgi:hypothetical protein